MSNGISNRFFHHLAIVESDNIGEGTRVWAFTHIMKGAKIGRFCNVGEQCYIENDVVIGDYCTIKNGVYLWDGIVLEDYVFLGPCAVFTNDKYPRSRNKDWKQMKTVIRRYATIGAGATVLCGIEIGRYAMVGAGAVVTKSVPDFAIVAGNPARIIGYACACGRTVIRIKSSMSKSSRRMRKRIISCEGCGRKYIFEKGRFSYIGGKELP